MWVSRPQGAAWSVGPLALALFFRWLRQEEIGDCDRSHRTVLHQDLQQCLLKHDRTGGGE